jgi:nucleoid DNA-binding protein
MNEETKQIIVQIFEEIQNILCAQPEYTAEEEQVRIKDFGKFLEIKNKWYKKLGIEPEPIEV